MVTWRASPAGLQPQFYAEVEAFLAGSPYHWVVLSAHRPLAEQRVLYAKYLTGGPRAAPPGRSAHNYGLAIDVALDTQPDVPGLQPSWDTRLAGWAWLKWNSLPLPRIGNGWRFGDWPHLERTRWERVKDWADAPPVATHA